MCQCYKYVTYFYCPVNGYNTETKTRSSFYSNSISADLNEKGSGMEKYGSPVARDNQETLLGNQSRDLGCQVGNCICQV